MRWRIARALLISISLFSAGCTRFDILNATVPTGGYIRAHNLPYGSLPRQNLDVYEPQNAPTDTKVVIFFYGGDWQNGKKEDYRFVAQALVSKGFVAVLPDYRLYPDVTFPAFVDDGAHAVRWVHDHIATYHGDPHRLFLMGHSAGAHIAALLNLDERYLKQAGVNRSDIRGTAALSGPYDFVPALDDRPVFRMTPEDIRPDPSAEPINFVDGHAPPMLLLQGAEDKVVDPANTDRLAAKIRTSGGSVQTISFPTLGHAEVVLALASSFHWLGPVLEKVSRFVDEH